MTGKIITRELNMQLNMQLRKESLKMFRLAGIRTLTSAIPVQRCTEKNARDFVLPVGKIALKPSINAQHDRYR